MGQIYGSSDTYDYEQPSLFRKSSPVARIKHICTECKRSILPGQRYDYVFGIWNGDARSFKTCSACLEISSMIDSQVQGFEGSYAFGDLWEELSNALYYHGYDLHPGNVFKVGRYIVTSPRFQNSKRKQNNIEQDAKN